MSGVRRLIGDKRAGRTGRDGLLPFNFLQEFLPSDCCSPLLAKGSNGAGSGVESKLLFGSPNLIFFLLVLLPFSFLCTNFNQFDLVGEVIIEISTVAEVRMEG